MGHPMLLVFVLALAAGSAGVTLVFLVPRRHRAHEAPWLRGAARQLLIFNLLLLVNLPYLYYLLHVEGGAPAARALGVEVAYHAVSVVLKILWIAFFYRMGRTLLGRDISRHLVRLARWGGPAAILLWVAATVGALVNEDAHICAGVHQLVEILVLGGAYAVTLALVFAPGARAPGSDQRLGRRLGLMLLAIWVLATLSMLAGQVATIITREASLFVNSLLILAYNGSFLIAVRARLAAAGDVPQATASDEQRWDHLARAYGLSTREQEVVRLVCQGKRNQEIAETLFISLQTVKDHNHRIYRKLGVRNRVELVNRTRELSC